MLETLYHTDKPDREKLELLASLLEQFPGMARHFLCRFEDGTGNLGLDFGALDISVRAMASRIRDKAKEVK